MSDEVNESKQSPTASPINRSGGRVLSSWVKQTLSSAPTGHPPCIFRKVLHAIGAYVVGVSLSLFLIHWILSQLPTPDQLAVQLDKEPSSMMLRIPRSFEELQAVHATLTAYSGLYFERTLLLSGAVYLFMQVFIVPGCFFVTILLGSLIPALPALLLVTVLTTAGCVANFLTTQYFLSDLLVWSFPKQVAQFQEAVMQHKNHLFNYLLFLRIVGIVPSWLINVGSPLAKVPLSTFFLTTVLGFQPQFIIFINGGSTLRSLHSWRDLYQWQAIAAIGACGALSLMPVLLKRCLPKEYTSLLSSSYKQLPR